MEDIPMRKLFYIAGFTALLAGSAASTAPAGPSAPASSAASQSAGLKIVDLHSRHHVITITATAAGPRYSAQTPAGEVIVSGLSLQQLQASQPDLYRQVSGTASTDSGSTLDARVDSEPVADLN